MRTFENYVLSKWDMHFQLCIWICIFHHTLATEFMNLLCCELKTNPNNLLRPTKYDIYTVKRYKNRFLFWSGKFLLVVCFWCASSTSVWATIGMCEHAKFYIYVNLMCCVQCTCIFHIIFRGKEMMFEEEEESERDRDWMREMEHVTDKVKEWERMTYFLGPTQLSTIFDSPIQLPPRSRCYRYRLYIHTHTYIVYVYTYLIFFLPNSAIAR